jgi:hypothetical protein
MAAKKQPKKRKKAKKEDNPKLVALGIFLCGLFAAAYGLVEGLIFKSTAVHTGPSGTFTMDPITSILFILGGLIGMGFAIWAWFNPPKP